MRRWLTLLLAFCTVCPAQDAGLEYRVKAAFLFNFAKFVEWPRETSGGTFTICLVGDPFGQTLDDTIRGETLQGRPLIVRRLTANGDPRQCHIIFFSDSENARTALLLDAIGSAPILTVGEDTNFITNGGMIRFTETGGRVHFEINPDAAERNSLKISSRLLRLANIVRPRQAGAR